GAFYVWTRAEIGEALGEDAAMFAAHYGVAEEGNVPEQLDPQGELRGKNILMQRRSLAATARAHGLEVEAASERIAAALEKLRERRDRRQRPLREDKIITAWNGLMISAMAKAAQVLGGGAANEEEKRYLRAATRATEFVEGELYDG